MSAEAERYARLHALFQAASGLDGSARTQYLDEQCGHAGVIHDVVFSPDGRQILSVDAERLGRIVDNRSTAERAAAMGRFMFVPPGDRRMGLVDLFGRHHAPLEDEAPLGSQSRAR